MEKDINWSGKKMLIAEDEESNLLYLLEVLQKTQITLIHANDGIDAVEKFKEEGDIDIVLMDIKMPLMNGYEATKQIKAINPDIAVIAQTAYAMSDDRYKALDAGCDDYISKPIRRKALLEIIAKFI